MIRENKTYEEISVGDEATQKRVLAANDLYVFAHASANLNPMHMPQQADDRLHEIVAPSMWVGALISSVLGNVLPGAGTLYKSQSLSFNSRAHVGDELAVTVKAVEKSPGNIVRFETRVVGRGGDVVAEGYAEVLAPIQKVRMDDKQMPTLPVQRHQHFDRLLAETSHLDPLPTAVVAPEEEHALAGAMAAARRAHYPTAAYWQC